MEYLKVTKDNIDYEDICCAMSNNQSNLKKEWLKKQFDEGLVFYKSRERGKCFIEYIPSENAWVPLDAKNYMYINCLWIAGKLKGHGYSNDLLNECIKDAKSKGKDGLCILSFEKRKKEFLSDKEYLKHKGFMLADTTPSGISLMYLPFSNDSIVPKFKPSAKSCQTQSDGVVIYYTYQCPFAYYWSLRIENFAKENNIPIKLIHINTKEMAQNMCAPVTTYALFKDGKFVTNVIQNEKRFLATIKSE